MKNFPTTLSMAEGRKVFPWESTSCHIISITRFALISPFCNAKFSTSFSSSHLHVKVQTNLFIVACVNFSLPLLFVFFWVISYLNFSCSEKGNNLKMSLLFNRVWLTLSCENEEKVWRKTEKIIWRKILVNRKAFGVFMIGVWVVAGFEAFKHFSNFMYFSSFLNKLFSQYFWILLVVSEIEFKILCIFLIFFNIFLKLILMLAQILTSVFHFFKFSAKYKPKQESRAFRFHLQHTLAF